MSQQDFNIRIMSITDDNSIRFKDFMPGTADIPAGNLISDLLKEPSLGSDPERLSAYISGADDTKSMEKVLDDISSNTVYKTLGLREPGTNRITDVYLIPKAELQDKVEKELITDFPPELEDAGAYINIDEEKGASLVFIDDPEGLYMFEDGDFEINMDEYDAAIEEQERLEVEYLDAEESTDPENMIDMDEAERAELIEAEEAEQEQMEADADLGHSFRSVEEFNDVTEPMVEVDFAPTEQMVKDGTYEENGFRQVGIPEEAFKGTYLEAIIKEYLDTPMGDRTEEMEEVFNSVSLGLLNGPGLAPEKAYAGKKPDPSKFKNGINDKMYQTKLASWEDKKDRTDRLNEENYKGRISDIEKIRHSGFPGAKDFGKFLGFDTSRGSFSIETRPNDKVSLFDRFFEGVQIKDGPDNTVPVTEKNFDRLFGNYNKPTFNFKTFRLDVYDRNIDLKFDDKTARALNGMLEKGGFGERIGKNGETVKTDESPYRLVVASIKRYDGSVNKAIVIFDMKGEMKVSEIQGITNDHEGLSGVFCRAERTRDDNGFAKNAAGNDFVRFKSMDSTQKDALYHPLSFGNDTDRVKAGLLIDNAIHKESETEHRDGSVTKTEALDGKLVEMIKDDFSGKTDVAAEKAVDAKNFLSEYRTDFEALTLSRAITGAELAEIKVGLKELGAVVNNPDAPKAEREEKFEAYRNSYAVYQNVYTKTFTRLVDATEKTGILANIAEGRVENYEPDKGEKAGGGFGPVLVTDGRMIVDAHAGGRIADPITRHGLGTVEMRSISETAKEIVKERVEQHNEKVDKEPSIPGPLKEEYKLTYNESKGSAYTFGGLKVVVPPYWISGAAGRVDTGEMLKQAGINRMPVEQYRDRNLDMSESKGEPAGGYESQGDALKKFIFGDNASVKNYDGIYQNMNDGKEPDSPADLKLDAMPSDISDIDADQAEERDLTDFDIPDYEERDEAGYDPATEIIFPDEEPSGSDTQEAKNQKSADSADEKKITTRAEMVRGVNLEGRISLTEKRAAKIEKKYARELRGLSKEERQKFINEKINDYVMDKIMPKVNELKALLNENKERISKFGDEKFVPFVNRLNTWNEQKITMLAYDLKKEGLWIGKDSVIEKNVTAGDVIKARETFYNNVGYHLLAEIREWREEKRNDKEYKVETSENDKNDIENGTEDREPSNDTVDLNDVPWEIDEPEEDADDVSDDKVSDIEGDENDNVSEETSDTDAADADVEEEPDDAADDADDGEEPDIDAVSEDADDTVTGSEEQDDTADDTEQDTPGETDKDRTDADTEDPDSVSEGDADEEPSDNAVSDEEDSEIDESDDGADIADDPEEDPDTSDEDAADKEDTEDMDSKDISEEEDDTEPDDVENNADDADPEDIEADDMEADDVEQDDIEADGEDPDAIEEDEDQPVTEEPKKDVDDEHDEEDDTEKKKEDMDNDTDKREDKVNGTDTGADTKSTQTDKQGILTRISDTFKNIVDNAFNKLDSIVESIDRFFNGNEDFNSDAVSNEEKADAISKGTEEAIKDDIKGGVVDTEKIGEVIGHIFDKLGTNPAMFGGIMTALENAGLSNDDKINILETASGDNDISQAGMELKDRDVANIVAAFVIDEELGDTERDYSSIDNAINDFGNKLDALKEKLDTLIERHSISENKVDSVRSAVCHDLIDKIAVNGISSEDLEVFSSAFFEAEDKVLADKGYEYTGDAAAGDGTFRMDTGMDEGKAADIVSDSNTGDKADMDYKPAENAPVETEIKTADTGVITESFKDISPEDIEKHDEGFSLAGFSNDFLNAVADHFDISTPEEMAAVLSDGSWREAFPDNGANVDTDSTTVQEPDTYGTADVAVDSGTDNGVAGLPKETEQAREPEKVEEAWSPAANDGGQTPADIMTAPEEDRSAEANVEPDNGFTDSADGGNTDIPQFDLPTADSSALENANPEQPVDHDFGDLPIEDVGKDPTDNGYEAPSADLPDNSDSRNDNRQDDRTEAADDTDSVDLPIE